MKLASLFVIAGLMFSLAGVSHAQTTTTGSVNGVVTDQSGAVIPDATIVLTKATTGAKQTAKSSGSGAYRFDLLQPGVYLISVEQPGFEKLESTVTVDSGQVLAANLKLKIGSNQQTVTVESLGTLLEADNGNVATTTSEQQIEQIPNSGNNMVYENKLVPGMGLGAPFGVIGSTLYTVDGLNNNDPYNAANNSGASNLMLGNNDVQEATVTGNGYSGQFGGFIGASVSFVSKGGGNTLHGDAAWYWTGSSLIANSFLHKAVTPIVPRSFENANEWAAEISGPVFIPHVFDGRNKLFFYADAEGLRGILPASPVTVALPSANLEAYTLSRLQAEGLTASIPYYNTMFSIYNAAATAHNAQPGNPTFSNTTTFPNASATGCPTSSKTLSPTDLAGLGLTNSGGVYTGVAGACGLSYSSNANNFANEATEIFRVDAVLGANDKGFFRYAHDNGSQPTTTDPINPLFDAISIQPQNTEQFNETHTFGTRAVNNLILGSVWYGAIFAPGNLPATLALFPAQLGTSDGSLSTLGGSDGSFPEGRNVTTLQAQDDVALTYGAHVVKFGVKAFFIKENDFNFGSGTNPTETVATLGAFINGGYDPAYTTGSGSSLTYSEATTFSQSFPQKLHYPVLFNQLAGYVEDDWKVNQALSATFALRVEHQGNIQCPVSCITVPAAPFPSLAHTASIPYNQAYSFNQKYSLPGLQELEWQPRVGFAYNPPIMHQSFVVRGGIGIFYDGLAGSVFDDLAKNPGISNSFKVSQDHLAPAEVTNLWADTAAYNTAFVNGITSGGTVASIKASLPTVAEQNSFTPPNLYGPQSNPHMYEIYKWNFEVQKAFGKSTVLSVNYLGNHGLHKPFTNAGLNAYSTGGVIAGLPTTIPDSRFGTDYYYQTEGMTNYNGVITTFTQRFPGAGVFTAGYTFGKTMDTGENNYATGGTGTTDVGSPPNPYNTNQEYGPAATDDRHYLTLNYVYKVPFKNIFYGGWQVSGVAIAYSGLPLTVIDTKTTSSINSYTTGNYGASLLAKYLGGGQASCNYYSQVCLASSDFSAATSVYANGPRNAFRGPKYVSTDFSLMKSIPLHWEGGTFTIGAQAFNVLNHMNFSKPTGSLSSSSFAKITGVVNPSGIFSGVGGDDSPRILQLKAKVNF